MSEENHNNRLTEITPEFEAQSNAATKAAVQELTVALVAAWIAQPIEMLEAHEQYFGASK